MICLDNTNRKFRDVSAWYHIVVRIDTTQATEADRVKLYVNGVSQTLQWNYELSKSANVIKYRW